jgi:S1-C subfamily serine protease
MLKVLVLLAAWVVVWTSSYPQAIASEAKSTRSFISTYRRVSSAVVGLSCRQGVRGHYFGTGTIIDPRGLVITSTTVVPEDALHLKVFLHGGVLTTGKVVLTDPRKELVLLRIQQPRARTEYAYVKLGNSDDVRLGDPAFTLGNAYQSIEVDDQVSLGKGLVSGLYNLDATSSQSKYSGPAIETSAHLNSGMDGGPLLDRDGAVLGILCLNYSRNRWLGTAIPINELKPLVLPHMGWFDDRAEGSSAYLGLELEEVEGEDGLVVRIVCVGEPSPAALAELRPGERITHLEGARLESLRALRRVFRAARPGETIQLEVVKADEPRQVKIQLWGRY